MATAKIKARSAKNDQYRISILLRHGDEKTMPSLGITIPQNHWDSKTLRVKRTVRSSYEINKKLEKYEQSFYEAFRSVGGDVAEVKLQDIVVEWERRCSEAEVVDTRDVVVAYRKFVADYKSQSNGLSRKSHYNAEYTCRLLEEYLKEQGCSLTIDEMADSKEFFKFGFWLKDRPMNDSTVAGYLKALRGFLKFMDVKPVKLDYIQPKHIDNKFYERNDKSDVILSDDLFEAVMNTKIDYMVKGRFNQALYNERVYLDNIKLILGHGFRYSDLYNMTTKDIMLNMTRNEEARHYFRYESPKKGKKDVPVPFYPGTKELIEYWADKDRTSTIVYRDLASKLREGKKMGKHIRVEERKSEGPNCRGKVKKYATNPDPVIPIAPNKPQPAMRRRVYEKIQQVWLVQEFGADWQSYKDEAIGFKKPVSPLSNGGCQDKELWEILVYHFGRHTFISRAVNKFRIPLPIVRDMVGHSDITVTEQYLHTKEDEIVNIVSNAYEYEPEVRHHRLMRKAQ